MPGGPDLDISSRTGWCWGRTTGQKQRSLVISRLDDRGGPGVNGHERRIFLRFPTHAPCGSWVPFKGGPKQRGIAMCFASWCRVYPEKLRFYGGGITASAFTGAAMRLRWHPGPVVMCR